MSLVVVGANSGIAQAVARSFADGGHRLILVARSPQSLESARAGIDRPALVDQGLVCDVADLEHVARAAEDIIALLDEDPYLLVAVGSVAEMEASRTNPAAAVRMIDVNFRNLVALVTPVAEAMAVRGRGTIILISSVAGDRGRQSNYVYGAAKAGLSAYAQGLRNRLASRGVHVLTVKPGYVDTPMLRQTLGEKFERTSRLLISDAASAGRRVHRAAVAKKDVIYVGGIWRLVMLAVRSIPERVFKRMKM